MNTDTIPCAFKNRVELRACEELRSMSEKCAVSCWKNAKNLQTFYAELQESREDLSSLMHKMLVTYKDNSLCSSFKTPLCAWQVCLSAKQHEGGYQLDPEEELLATKRNIAFGKKDHPFMPPRCYRSNVIKENSNENGCIERDTVKDATAKSASCVNISNGHFQDGGKRSKNVRSESISPHTGFKFYHSNFTAYHIKSYREQITNNSIRKHIQSRLKEDNKLVCEKESPKKTPDVEHKAIPKPSFTFYRFRISRDKTSDSGYSKVGPCPRMTEQKEFKKADVNRCNKLTASGKEEAQVNIAPASAEKNAEQKGKEIKSVTTLKFQTKFLLQRGNTATDGGHANDASKIEINQGTLKKVQLRVNNSSDSPRLVSKTGRANKAKVRLLGACIKPTIYHKSSSEISRVTWKPTFGDKEFLRITTPRPLIHYQSQTPSDFDESPGFSPVKSVEISPVRSPVPSVSGTSLRSQVIDEILMKREPQAVFPKNSNFQACITPSNYSTSSVETHIRNRKVTSPTGHGQNATEEKNQNDSHVQRIPSKPSIPRIGPFISG